MADPTTPMDCRDIIKQDVAGLCFERIHFDSNFTSSTFWQCVFLRCRLDRLLMARSHWNESRFEGSKLVVFFDDSVFESCSFRDTTFQGLRGEYGGLLWSLGVTSVISVPFGKPKNSNANEHECPRIIGNGSGLWR